MNELDQAVDTVVGRCLGVREGEQVVVVADPGTRSIGEALRDGAAEVELRRAVDHAHPAAPRDRLDPAAGDLAPRRELQRRMGVGDRRQARDHGSG